MIVVTSGIGEGSGGNRNHTIGGAVACGSEGGGIGGAGTGEVGEGATGNGDVGFSEIGGGF